MVGLEDTSFPKDRRQKNNTDQLKYVYSILHALIVLPVDLVTWPLFGDHLRRTTWLS